MTTKIKYRFAQKDLQGKDIEWTTGTLLGFVPLTPTLEGTMQIDNGGQVTYTSVMRKPYQETVHAMIARDTDGMLSCVPFYCCKLVDEEG